ncbi:myosin-like antigen [Heliothis zea nudivirus]|uniref:Myosin-like antigen n=1 Tax=Heliothis zea nudivirus 1 TaxID=3116536 RepID=Q8JKR4_9VIRU|nr:myosin-like antigen [Heliothis zea nudivirus]AAN04341.1 myosin-like antigen [Heliothis zea nudivirus]
MTEYTFKNFKSATTELIHLITRMYNSMQPLYDKAQGKINSVRIKLLRDSVDLYDLHSFLNDEYRHASRTLSDQLNDLTLITTGMKYDTSSFTTLRRIVGRTLNIKRVSIQTYLNFVNVYNKVIAASDRLLQSLDRVQTLYTVPMDFTSVVVRGVQGGGSGNARDVGNLPMPTFVENVGPLNTNTKTNTNTNNDNNPSNYSIVEVPNGTLNARPLEQIEEYDSSKYEGMMDYENFAAMVDRKDADYLNRIRSPESDSKLNVASYMDGVKLEPEETKPDVHVIDLLNTINDKLNLMELAINDLSQTIHEPVKGNDDDVGQHHHFNDALQDRLDSMAKSNEKQINALEDHLTRLIEEGNKKSSGSSGSGSSSSSNNMPKIDAIKAAIQTSLESYLVDYMEPLLDRLSVRLKNVVNQNIENFMQALVESEKVQDERYRNLLTQNEEIVKFLSMFNFERLQSIMQQVVDGVRQVGQSQIPPEQMRQLLDELKTLNASQRISSIQTIAKLQNALTVLGSMADTEAVRDLERLLRELESFTLRQAGVVTFDELQAANTNTEDWSL